MKRKRSRRLWLKLILFVLFFLGLLVLGYFFITLFLPKKQLFVSPLPLISDKNLFFSQASGKSDQIEDSLKKSHIEYVSVQSTGESSYLVILKNGQEVFFSSKKNIPTQVSSLQLILSRLTIEGKEFSTLDLRYNKPVVVFK